MLTIERIGSECRMTLVGDMTIYQAQALYDELAPLFEEDNDFSIDLAQVSKIDSSIVQILMMAHQHWLANGQRFNLLNHSETVINALEAMGLVAWFRDPLLICLQREQEVTD
jgi:anti-sigma B factor antagonist